MAERAIEVGAFIPVGNHGWIHSVNAPAVETGTYARVREVVQGAERLGFDFVLSPAIWRGRKGPSQHWMHSLESLTTSAALLAETSRIGVYATVHVTVFPPPTIAKMIATLDQIGPGRVGLNLVTGSSYLDLAHLGIWNDELDHDQRYDMADEWVTLVKELWSDPVVNHKGEFFETADATMGPKPSRRPQLVNAGMSPRGLRFAAENCDVAFISTSDDPKLIATARAGKEMARKLGSPNLKTCGLLHVIGAETDEEAQARLDHFNAGVDVECLEDIAAGYEQNRSYKDVSKLSKTWSDERNRSSVGVSPLVGSYETLARRMATAINEGELDGVLLIVPDYVKDLQALATKAFPLLAEYGITCNASAPATA